MRSSSAITPRNAAAARRYVDAQRRLHREREGEGVGDGAESPEVRPARRKARGIGAPCISASMPLCT